MAIVAFDAGSTSISQNEGDGGQTTNYTFQVNRTVNTSGVVTVDFEVTGGVGSLARVGDFVGGAFPSGTVTFNDGVTSQNITIAVAGDFNFEQTEDFFVTLSNPSNDAVLGAQTVATGTIVNDDVLAAMGFDPAASNVQQSQAEGNAGTTVYSFVVNRVNNTQVTSSVAYAVTANTADGADFVGGSLPSGILEFAVGDDSQTIEIAIAADTTIEEDEGFTLSLSSNNNGSLTTPTTATAIIENDDFITPTISLDVANGAPQQQAEGAVGAGAVFTFEVNRANANGSTSLSYAVVGVGANPVTGADFVGGVLPSGTVVFGSSSVTSQSISVNVLGDADVEADESFTIEFSNPTNAAIDNASNPTVTIVNDDFATPVVGFMAGSDIAENEGDTGNTPFTFTVNRSITTGDNSTSQVTYTVAGSGANPANADDFAGALQGTLNFAQGVPSQTITVLVAGDFDVEANEDFTVTLAVADNATLGTATATGTITNDDAVPVMSFDSALSNVQQSQAEGNAGTTTYSFVVNRTGNTGVTSSVAFNVVGAPGNAGAAANGADFVGGSLPSGVLNFAVDETSATIQIAVAGDTLVEGDEGFEVNLIGRDDGLVAAPVTATGIITNDDDFGVPVVGFVTAAVNQNEGDTGNTPFTFTVNRSIESGDDSTSQVTYTVAGNTAAADDFASSESLQGTVNFAQGVSSQTITVLIAGDSDVEADETFTVTLAVADNATLGTATATGTIANDDAESIMSFDSASANTQQSQAEGDAGLTVYSFVVNRTSNTGITSSVEFDVIGASIAGVAGTAASGGDFVNGVLPSGVLNFAVGQTSATIEISVVGDTSIEQDEAFQIRLSGRDDGLLTVPITAMGIITNDDFPTPGISLDVANDAPQQQAEGANGQITEFTFAINRADARGTSSVDFAVVGTGANPATAADFENGVLPSGSATFNGTETTQIITVRVVGDADIEPSESFTVQFSNPVNAVIDNASNSIVTIINDDFAAGVISFDANDIVQSQVEGDSGVTEFTLDVTRSSSGVNASVDYAVQGVSGGDSGGDSADANDFVGNALPSGTINFNSTQTQQTITIQVVGDTIEEADEVFTVVLSNPAGASIADASSTLNPTLTIVNDDFPTPGISLGVANGAPQQQAEGANGQITEFTFAINRADARGTSSVDFAVVGTGANPATAADFENGVLPSGTATFNGTDTTQIITVRVVGDTEVEGDESFTIQFSNPVNAVIDNAASPTVTIANDDVVSVIGFALSPSSNLLQPREEGDAGTTTFSFTLTRSGDTSAGATVNYELVSASTLGADVNDFVGNAFPSGSVSFAANQTTAIIEVEVVGDVEIEESESFLVNLLASTNVVMGTISTVVGTITNDDFPTPGLSLGIATGAPQQQAEGGDGQITEFTFVINRADALGTSSVDYAVVGIGANPVTAADFENGVLPSGTATFNGTETTQTITVRVVGDTDIEQDESFTVQFSNPVNAVIDNAANPIVTIVNDDVESIVSFSAAPSSNLTQIRDEGDADTITTFSFTLTRSGDTSTGATVNYEVAGASIPSDQADADDFVGGAFPSGSVFFAANQTTATIEVEVVGDVEIEVDESFSVTLTESTNVLMGAIPAVLGTITNDDFPTPTISFADDPANTQQQQDEGADGQITEFTFVVSRADARGTSSVDFAVVGTGANPATAADFENGQLPSGTVTFSDTDITQTVTVRVVGDAEVEEDETFTIQFSNPVGAVIDGASNPTVTITNDDIAASLIGFTANTVQTQNEGDAGSIVFEFEVTRTGNADIATSVSYTVEGLDSNGATADDFVGDALPQGAIEFAAGESNNVQTISVSVVGDTQVEEDETFIVRLSSNDDNVTISDDEAMGTILNDDILPEISFALSNLEQSQEEGDRGETVYEFVVARTGNISSTSSVAYTVSGIGSNATDSDDFVTVSGRVEFAAGVDSQTLQILVVGELRAEQDEAFVVTLSDPSDSVLGDVIEAQGIIEDDEPLCLPIEATNGNYAVICI